MPDPLQQLRDALDAGDDTRAEEVVGALVAADGETLLQLRRMVRDPDPDRRWWAVRALAAIGTPEVVEPIIQMLKDVDVDVRACAVLALAHLKPQEAIDPLVRRLADDSAYVGRLSADALSRFGHAPVEALIDALEGGDTATRAGAARALSALRSQEAIPALYKALDDPSAVVTYYAEEALNRMGVGIVLFRP